MPILLNDRERVIYEAAQAGDAKTLKSLQALVFERPVVGVREFVESPDYLDHKGKIYESVIELLEAVFQPHIREAHIEIGRGAGKSVLAALFQAYNLYWLDNLRRPQEFYGRRPGSTISVINVSISAEQAQAVIFEELLSLIEKSKYFKGKFVPRKRDLFFPKKHLRAIAGHSGSIAWRGYTTFAGIADEINYMRDKRNKSNADEMWAVLQGSTSTRFPGSYKLISISSSREKGDFEDRNMSFVKKNGIEVALPHILKHRARVAGLVLPSNPTEIIQVGALQRNLPGIISVKSS